MSICIPFQENAFTGNASDGRDPTPAAISKQCQTDVGKKEISLQPDSQKMSGCAGSYLEERFTDDK